MKYLLLLQIGKDLDVVELLFHDLSDRTMEFTFVAVLSDGAEQYISMPSQAYRSIVGDVSERLFTSARDFVKVDMEWAREGLTLLHDSAAE